MFLHNTSEKLHIRSDLEVFIEKSCFSCALNDCGHLLWVCFGYLHADLKKASPTPLLWHFPLYSDM